VLGRTECLRLLALRAGGVGRVGLVESEGVLILPVNYRMLDEDIVIQVGEGSMLDAARRQAIVGFEVDEVGETEGRAWSVFVRGLATVLDPQDRPSAVRARPVERGPLVPEPGMAFVRIRTGVLTGRRFALLS
jgi:nitroimidazol reductase NimA-like FMN-containing flavoprotein (pyridoxamine 5'-phosphate oxidase superfamily)